MKKALVMLTLCIFVTSFALAANGIQARDATGPYHDEVMAEGGMNGTPNPELIQERDGAQIQARVNIKEGDYNIQGKQIRIEERDENKIRLRSQNISAETRLELREENVTGIGKVLRATLSNGRFADVKIMPDRASDVALQRLRIRNCNETNNCTIELKEVGQGEQTRAAYEVRAEKEAKLFGFLSTKMQVQSQVDAETGEVVQVKKPWWSFLAKEQDETTASE